jgi:PAS domain S-box-containing protein
MNSKRETPKKQLSMKPSKPEKKTSKTIKKAAKAKKPDSLRKRPKSDMPERDRPQEALKQSEARHPVDLPRDAAIRERLRLEAILNAVPSGLIVYDAASSKIILQNQQVSELFGKPLDAADQELRVRDMRMTKPDGAPFQPAELPGMRAIETGKIIRDVEMLVTRPDGQQLMAHVCAAPLRDEKGAITGSVIAFNDISQRKKMEEDVKTILRTAMDGFWIVDSKARFLDVNEAYCNIVGYCRDELLRMGIQDVELLETPEVTALHIQKVMDVGSDRFETRHRKKDGGVVDLEVSVNRMTDGSGRLFVFLRDITERKKGEDALKQANLELTTVNKELEAFSYAVSHDLRAPLRSIEGFTAAILEDHAASLDETAKDYFHRVTTASRRMSQLIDAMLVLARMTKGELREKTVDLSGLAGLVAHELRNKQPERRMSFVITPGIKARGDFDMLRVVLENLLDNAWKFTSKHDAANIEFGVLDCGLRTAELKSEIANPQYEIVYFVRDDGAGFNMEFSDKLFKPFKRLHGDSEFPGLGIGLAIAYRIISRHGGRIWAEGDVEKGATVFFTL